MSVIVGYTGYYDTKRNCRINITSKELIFTVSKSTKQRMKQFDLEKIERKIQYPSNQQIRNDGISFITTYNDGSESEESEKLLKRYPLTLCNFLLNKKLKTNDIQHHMDSFGVSVIHEHKLHDLAMLKYYETDRIVKITALSPIPNQLQIFKFMQKHIRKYVVTHVEWNEQQQKWTLLTQLSDGTPVIPYGGAMSVSANEIDVLCNKQDSPITEYYIHQNYLLKQKNKVLQKYYDQNAEKWLDFIERFIWYRLDHARYWDKWTEETIFMDPNNKIDEFDKALKKYDMNEQWEFKNKAKTQETMTFGMDSLKDLFGDDIQINHTEKKEKFMVTATKMTLTYFLNKPKKKNFKIRVYIQKTELKQTK
eukprot:165265_1